MSWIMDELERLKETYDDPWTGSLKRERQEVLDLALPLYGVVSDNRDPECQGRLRVACDMIAPGAVTGWIPVIRHGAGRGTGWWQLPDVGTQVVLGFVGNRISRPVVLGCIYDEKHKPPPAEGKRAERVVYQTKKQRIELIDEEGKEGIIIHSKGGKIRVELTKAGGIRCENELGDIRIKCRKLRIEGENTRIQAEKGVRIRSGEDSTVQAKKVRFECGKEVKVRGKNIKLEASRGITAEGKQMAGEGDKVMGFDIHQMEIPAGLSTAVVPLPHPYIGKLAEMLSENVKIKGHNAAVKGSKSKHDNPLHLQLPGTIRFIVPPSKEGVVSEGTSKKVKINGKEAAVAGSQVTTCNDLGLQHNSVVMAPGASMPMPVIINPKNMDEYNRERERQERRKPDCTQARWDRGRCKEGEEVELHAQVRDIADGNMVVFQVWKAGQDPASHIAQAVIRAVVEGGAAKEVWLYKQPGNGEPPGEDPQYFFTVHCVWCPMKRSGMLEIQLKRPEINNPQWQNSEGSQTSRGLVGEMLKPSVSCNGDTEEGAPVVFRVYPEGADPEHDRPVAELAGENAGGTAEAEWTATEIREAGDTSELNYFFTATTPKAKEVKSGSIGIKNPEVVKITFDPEILYQKDDITVTVKTFEVSPFSPQARFQLWEQGQKRSETPVLEKEITVDADEVELTLESGYLREALSNYKQEKEYLLEPEIACEGMGIKQRRDNPLRIIVGVIDD